MVPPALTPLGERFASLVRRLGGPGDATAAAASLLAAWAGPGRRYHGLAHLRDCLARLDEAPAAATDRDRVEAALWYHDVVYDPRAADNEERSAVQARGELAALGVPPAVAEDVARLVRLTRHDGPTADPAGRLLCDIDLSILGRSTAEFEVYDRGIRDEYAWVPEDAYRVARRQVLDRLFQRRPLYQTDHFRDRYEGPARANLERALAVLRVPPS
jgi:predicted metal-dependent HD superfamily phosphohydrolase